MSRTAKALASLTAAIREEVARELREQQDDTPLLTAQRRVRTLEAQVRKLRAQRDTHRGRCSEMRATIARYQKELVELRAARRSELKTLPWNAR